MVYLDRSNFTWSILEYLDPYDVTSYIKEPRYYHSSDPSSTDYILTHEFFNTFKINHHKSTVSKSGGIKGALREKTL